MLFKASDIEHFLTNKAFIDTVIVPLIAIDVEEDKIRQSGSATDYLYSLTGFIEHQFKGRIMLMPACSYLTATRTDDLAFTMEKALHEAGFKHVFFMTCDHEWSALQDQLNVIWLPSIPLESMDDSVRKKILEDQLTQVIPLLSAKWSQ